MKSNNNIITAFEHQIIKVDHKYNNVTFTEEHRDALESFYGKGVPYYSLVHKGIQFNEHVGIIQVGKLIIEILPKADKTEDTPKWRNVLIGMLKSVGAFDIQAPSQSSLSLKSNFILDLYFELFIKELEYLIHKGLIKKYRKIEGNTTSLKGALSFGKHIQKNLVHQERFFVKYNTYDQQHLIHQVLFAALSLLKSINSNTQLQSRIGTLFLNFPEMPSLKVNEATFERIIYNRKNQEYKNAVEIARLLLLNYHPDLSKGQNNVLAIMFDMNLLWERFVYVCLRKKCNPNFTVKAQYSKYFWKPLSGNRATIRPDIVINFTSPEGEKHNFILDTKWKNIGGNNPSPEDLRQLFVYHEYFNAKKVALLYPGAWNIRKGNYFNKTDNNLSNKECSVITLPTNETITEWQNDIVNKIVNQWIIN